MIIMNKKLKKKIIITQKEHDEWHKKHKDYDGKISKEHEACHRKFGIVVKKRNRDLKIVNRYRRNVKKGIKNSEKSYGEAK